MFDRLSKIDTVSILDDGVIIDFEWANGRPIPAIIIDANNRPDIVEYITVHKDQPPGDVVIQWGSRLYSKKKISLVLKSSRPISLEFAIEFDKNKHHALIDGILINNGFYLFHGKKGDKVSGLITNDNARILVEVPFTGFEPTWDNILEKTIKNKFKKQGVSRKVTANDIKEYVKKMREIWQIRKDT